MDLHYERQLHLYPTAVDEGVVKLKGSHPANLKANRMNAEQTVLEIPAAEIINHILEDLQKLSTPNWRTNGSCIRR